MCVNGWTIPANLKVLTLCSVILVFLSCYARKHSQEGNIENSPNNTSVIDSSLSKAKYNLKKDTANMDFEIQIPTIKPTRNNVVVNLTFKNKSDKTIRLLDMFDPPEIFFSLRISAKEGKSFIPLLGGFIDFPHGMKLQYIEIKPNHSFAKALNISAILKKQNIELERLKYGLEMSYFNYKGEDCIKGKFKSNVIELNLTE